MYEITVDDAQRQSGSVVVEAAGAFAEGKGAIVIPQRQDCLGKSGARSGAGGAGLTLLALPPYSPELNPVERVWHYLRSHWLANSVFPNLADIMGACETAWNRFAADHALIRSLCAVGWAPASSAP